MSDKARLSKALQALRVIRTWADFPGALDPVQVLSLIDRTSREIGGLQDTAAQAVAVPELFHGTTDALSKLSINKMSDNHE